MSSARQNQNQQQNQQPAGPQGTVRPFYDTIDFVYNQGSEGNVTANDTIAGSDFTKQESDAGNQLATNEVAEIFKIEYIPATKDPTSGRLHTWDTIRIDYDGNLYDNVRYREFMLGFEGPDFQVSTPPLGVPVLSGLINPEQDKINTATPKFGPNTTLTASLTNDATAIDDSFTVRFHLFRWRGDESELRDFFQATYGRTTFQQDISMHNPFTGNRREFERASPVRIEPGAEDGARGAFKKLTGGVDQSQPKVWPWVTWANNDIATTANEFFKFQTDNNEVDVSWKELEFDLTDQKEARFFNFVQVNSVPALFEAQMVIDERDRDPRLKIVDTSRHQLPVVRPLDGTTRAHDRAQLPAAFGTHPTITGRRIGSNLLGGRQVIWDDGGGLRVRDNGNTINSGQILVGVQGKRLELTS